MELIEQFKQTYPRVSLDGLRDLIFSDRYALKDPNRDFRVGDKVVVLVEMMGDWPRRETGIIQSIDGDHATVMTSGGEEVTKPLSDMDRVLEQSVSDMWDRIAYYLPLKTEAKEKVGEVAEAFRWGLEDFRFSPGGRINAYIGSEQLRHLTYMPDDFDNLDLTAYNCLSGETIVHTEDGLVPIKDLVGKTVKVLSMDGVMREAQFASFGVQELMKVELSTGEVIYATPNHRWYVTGRSKKLDEVTTVDLEGKHIPIVSGPRPEYACKKRATVRVEKVSVTDRVEEVYCAIEPETHSFVIGSGVLTGNCFVIPMKPNSENVRYGADSRKAIIDTLGNMVEIMSRGGGVGVNLSALRPTRAYVQGVNGHSSGAVSWGGLFSYTTGLVEQGGSRRGALMLILDDWHPSVIEFISSKVESGIEEIAKKWGPKFPFATFKHHGITNANISVAVSDDFMQAVKSDSKWDLVFPDYEAMDKGTYNREWDGDIRAWREKGYPVKVYATVKARDLWEYLMESAWRSAEPGVVFLERYNKESNSWYYSKVICTNPCLTGDTIVHSPEGDITIKELAERGEEYPVYTYNREVNKVEVRTGINPVKTKENAEVVKVTFDDGTFIRLTPDHRVWKRDYSSQSWDEGYWFPAGDLESGDVVSPFVYNDSAEGSKKVVSVDFDGREDVYDLTVPGTHSFFANGILVHNCGEQGLPGWGVCNLGHINLSRFVQGPIGAAKVDWEGSGYG